MLNQNDSLYALVRFISSLIVVLVLALYDLSKTENIPSFVYLLIGGLNGVDLYNLFRANKEAK